MKLYDVIIKEFTDDDNIKNLAKLFMGNPIDNGVSEEEFRNTFVHAVGYDPTRMYDYKKIDDMVDALAPKSNVNIDKARETSKQRYINEKDILMSQIVSDEMGVFTNATWESAITEGRSFASQCNKMLNDYNSGKIDSSGNPIESHPICDLLSKPTKNYELDDEDDDFDDDLDDDFDTDFNDDDLDDEDE